MWLRFEAITGDGSRRFRWVGLVLAFAALGWAVPAVGQAAVPRAGGGVAAVSAVEQAAEGLQEAVAELNLAGLRVPRADRQALLASQASIERNLSEAVPGLIASSQAAPGNLGLAFRLYRDLEVVLGVAQRSADAMPAQSGAGANRLRAANRALEASLNRLGDWIETQGMAQYSRLRPAARPAAAPPAPAPKTLIINNANAPAPARKRAPAPRR